MNPLELIIKRPDNSHKGTFGTVKLLCGSEKYTGAAILACGGALRSGCGLVKLFAPEFACHPVRFMLPEVICADSCEFDSTSAQSAVIGCGISDIYENTLADTILRLDCPTVIDADGINFLSRHINLLTEVKADLILTPHPAEFSRLTGISVDTVNENRVCYAQQFAEEYGCVLVLKGHETVITCKGKEPVINQSGNSSLSKGGSGDVLAGVIGSLTAQGYNSYEAARIGVYCHGRAGEILSGKYGTHGVLPSDLPAVIGNLLG